MQALVTGGNGFLGLYIVEQLLERGDRVRVVSRTPHPRLQELGVEWMRGDVRDPDAVRTACAGVDTVFHVAAIPGIWGSWSTYYETNTVGTRNVIDGCIASGVQRLVYTSSPSVVFDQRPQENIDETTPYPAKYLAHYPHSKALAEQEVLQANGRDGLATVSLRPHLIWGPRDNHLIPRLVQRAKAGRLRRVGDGGNLISVSYVENAAAAHLQAADALAPDSPVAGQNYFINEPEPVNLWQWVNELLVTAGLPPIQKSISVGTAWKLGAAMEAAWTILRLQSEPPMTRFLAAQLGHSHYYSIAKAQRDFGYTPRVSFEEGMRRLQPDLQRLGRL